MFLLEEHARELANGAPEWGFYRIECLRDNDRELIAAKIVGAVAPPKTRGKYKGQPNWRKMDKTTRRTVYITPVQNDVWCKLWEEKTGKCRECTGSGETFSGWSVRDGTRTRVCSRCGGNGLSVVPAPEPADDA